MMSQLFTHPLHWYIAGPLIGLVVPTLLLLGNKPFGVSSNFRHLCAAVWPGRDEFFSHDWKRLGGWNLAFLSGIFAGAILAWQLAPPLEVAISPDTATALHRLGLTDLTGLAPHECSRGRRSSPSKVSCRSSSEGSSSASNARRGCTSGHAIAGLANLQPASLVAVCGFFAGGLAGTYFVLPMLFR